jgi:hypothetical protein
MWPHKIPLLAFSTSCLTFEMGPYVSARPRHPTLQCGFGSGTPALQNKSPPSEGTTKLRIPEKDGQRFQLGADAPLWLRGSMIGKAAASNLRRFSCKVSSAIDPDSPYDMSAI